jgi:hypothetical protein
MYLFAEPSECDGRRINDAEKRKHRDEIARFAQKVNGAEVVFGAISYREWLNSWPRGDPELARHHAAIIERFQP